MATRFPILLHNGVESFLIKQGDGTEYFIPTYFTDAYAEFLETEWMRNENRIPIELLVPPQSEFTENPPSLNSPGASKFGGNPRENEFSTSKPAFALVKTELSVTTTPFSVASFTQTTPDALPYLVVPSPKRVPPKAGKRFWYVSAALYASSVAEMESAYGAISRGCTERGLLYGPNPGRGRLYGVKLGLNTISVIVGILARRKNPESEIEFVAMPFVGLNTYMTIRNTRLCR
jgi:hypothetical protein